MIAKVDWRHIAHYYAQSYCKGSADKMCGRCRGCTEIRDSWAEMRRLVKLQATDRENAGH